MQQDITVRTTKRLPLLEFLQEHDFFVEEIETNVYKVSSDATLDVFMTLKDNVLYFELEVGNIEEFATEELYRKLLDLNTEILPVSLGLDTTSSNHLRLVVVESREVKNLDENELLAVFEAMEIASAKVEVLLDKFIK